MNRYKNLRCSCGKKATAANGKTKDCPSCGTPMIAGENWYLRYEHNGKSITEASTTRIIDVEARMAEIRLNKAAGRTMQKEKPIAWDDAVKAFHARNLEQGLSVNTIKFYANCLKSLDKVFSGRNLQDLTRGDVVTYRSSRIKDTSNVTGNHDVMTIKRVYAVAMDQYSARQHQELHIAGAEISRIAELPTKAKTRALSMSEIKAFWNNPGSIPPSVHSALKLILLTGQRPGEVAGMHHGEIDGNWWTLPATRAKNKIATRVWLTDEALALVGKTPNRIYISNCLLREIEGGNAMKLQPFTPHDLRRSMATQLAEMGIGDEVIDSILNHVKTGVIRVYNVYRYDDQKKTALEAWSKKLMSFLTGETGKVIRLPMQSAA